MVHVPQAHEAIQFESFCSNEIASINVCNDNLSITGFIKFFKFMLRLIINPCYKDVNSAQSTPFLSELFAITAFLRTTCGSDTNAEIVVRMTAHCGAGG